MNEPSSTPYVLKVNAFCSVLDFLFVYAIEAGSFHR